MILAEAAEHTKGWTSILERLVSYSARPGLRLFSLEDRIYWTSLVATPEGGLRWGDAEGPLISWEFGTHGVSGFRWTSASGESVRAERLHDYGYLAALRGQRDKGTVTSRGHRSFHPTGARANPPL